MVKSAEEIRKDAYKEFAEEIKKYASVFQASYSDFGSPSYAVAVKVSAIDELLEEMAGE